MEYLGENLLYGIECNMEIFTSTEKELASYILKFPGETSQLSINQIAKKLHLSPATITRFCQKLSFSGFNEFKHELRRFIDLQNAPVEVNNIQQVDYLAKLYQDHTTVLRNTFQINTYRDIQEVVSFLIKAERIHVYGIGSSGIAAQEFKYKFFRIGLYIEAITDPHHAIMDASLISKKSVVIGISISGETQELIKTIKIAKKQGLPIIIFTGNKDSQLAKLSNVCLLVTSKSNMHMGQNISPLLPFLLLFDLIYTELIAEDYKKRIHLRDKTLRALGNIE